MRVRTLFTVIFCLWACIGSSTLVTSRCAFAQGPDAKAAAQKKAREGQRQAGKGEHEKALALFKEAYDSNPEPGYLYNVGIEQQALGRDVEAFTSFEHFLRDVQKIPPEFVADANQRQRELRKRIGELELRCTEEGAHVSIDDSSIGETPMADPVRVSAGAHRLAFQKDGFEPFRASVHVNGGSKQQVEASMRPIAVALPAKTATVQKEPAAIVPVAPSATIADRSESRPSERTEQRGYLFHGSVSAGAGFWLLGARQTPQPAIALGLGAGFRVAGSSTSAELRLGVKGGLSFVSEPASTDVLLSALVNPMFVIHAVPNRVFFFVEVGVGVLALSGVTEGSVLLRAEAANVSGALAALEVRPGLGGAVAIGDAIALYLSPSLAWSPSPSPLFEESSIVRVEMAGGLMVGF